MAILYKYRPYAKARDILTKCEFYFSTPTQLNDPYDCRISIRHALEELIAKAKRDDNLDLHARLLRFRKIDSTYDKMETDIGNVGVLSLSRNPSNVVMWAHYADNHAGFCAGFQLSK